MTVKIASGTATDSYFQLIRQFPLARIKDSKHLKAAVKVIDRLLQEDLDTGGQEYLDVLTEMVEIYEDEHVLIPDASEADVLQELMRSHSLKQLQLSKRVGIAQSTISAVLNGGRSLTKGQVLKLAKHFNVSPAVFLPA
jgi:HTH-type transcriptional regulator/antitoxin HigA